MAVAAAKFVFMMYQALVNAAMRGTNGQRPLPLRFPILICDVVNMIGPSLTDPTQVGLHFFSKSPIIGSLKGPRSRMDR